MLRLLLVLLVLGAHRYLINKRIARKRSTQDAVCFKDLCRAYLESDFWKSDQPIIIHVPPLTSTLSCFTGRIMLTTCCIGIFIYLFITFVRA